MGPDESTSLIWMQLSGMGARGGGGDAGGGGGGGADGDGGGLGQYEQTPHEARQ